MKDLALRQSEEAQLIGLQVEAVLASAASLEPEVRMKALLGAAAYCGMKDYSMSPTEIEATMKHALEQALVALAMEVS